MMPDASPEAAIESMTATDVVQMYSAFAHRLELMVRGAVRAPRVVIEDACQVAWVALIACRARLDPSRAPGWLVQTAVHEALRLMQVEEEEDSLEHELEDRAETCLGTDPGPEHFVLEWQRVSGVTVLPVRQQRLVWLRALGLSYEEMASHEHCTDRTVRRQLERAGRALRSLDTEDQPLTTAA
jgi:DNA-directed RNA polymerase specialized sigma24 family protein